MVKERLSKLQKWILMALYLIDGGEGSIRVRDLKETSVYGLKIWGKSETLESPWRKERMKGSCIDVSFSRTLRSLIHKDLLFDYPSNLTKETRGINVFDDVSNLSAVALTEEGQVMAKGLLNVKSAEVNNKTKRR